MDFKMRPMSEAPLNEPVLVAAAGVYYVDTFRVAAERGGYVEPVSFFCIADLLRAAEILAAITPDGFEYESAAGVHDDLNSQYCFRRVNFRRITPPRGGEAMNFTSTPYDEHHVAATNAAADKFREINKPKLKEAVDKAVKDIAEQLYESIESTFENDVAYNFGGMVRDRVRYIMIGLLNGGWQDAMAMNWLRDFDFREYRNSVYLANHEAIQSQLVDDLRAQIAELKKEIAYQKRRNGEYV